MAEGPWLQVFFRQRLTKLTMIKPGKGFPQLRGRAADVQSLAGAILALFSSLMDEEDMQHRQIRIFLGLNSRLADILEAYGPRYGFAALPVEQTKEAFRLGCQMAQLHAMFMLFYKDADRKLINLTTKTHFVLHSLQLSKFIHPAMVWRYKGESTMHRMQTVWKSCLPAVKHPRRQLSKRDICYGCSTRSVWLQHKVSTG